MADLPRQLTSVRAMRRRNEEASEVLNKTNALVKAHEDTEAPIDNIIKHNIAQLQNRYALNFNIFDIYDSHGEAI